MCDAFSCCRLRQEEEEEEEEERGVVHLTPVPARTQFNLQQSCLRANLQLDRHCKPPPLTNLHINQLLSSHNTPLNRLQLTSILTPNSNSQQSPLLLIWKLNSPHR